MQSGRFADESLARTQGALGGALAASSWALDRYVLPRLYEGLHALWLPGWAIGVVLVVGRSSRAPRRKENHLTMRR
ncbi:MAG: hypothetical protein U0174_17515 [Polyangiaceae bacterium]